MSDTIHEWELREALEEAASVNHGPNGERFDVDEAIAHWRQHPTGTEGAVTPNDNDGYATRLVDQIAVGYVLADGPWWKAEATVSTTRRTVDAPDYRAWAGDGPNAERVYRLRHEHGYLDVMTRFMELVDAADDDDYDAEALAAQALAEFGYVLDGKEG